MGVSGVEDVIAKFGEPKAVDRFSTNVRYTYSNFAVSIQNTPGKINSISIFDRNFTDPNGIDVGTNVKTVEKKFNLEINDDYFVDENRGIIYWFREDHISKIVFAYELDL